MPKFITNNYLTYLSSWPMGTIYCNMPVGGEAVNAEDHIAFCGEEAHAYRRNKTEYAERERVRGTNNISIFIEMQQLQLRTTNLYKRLQKSLYIVTNLGQLPFMLFT